MYIFFLSPLVKTSWTKDFGVQFLGDEGFEVQFLGDEGLEVQFVGQRILKCNSWMKDFEVQLEY